MRFLYLALTAAWIGGCASAPSQDSAEADSLLETKVESEPVQTDLPVEAPTPLNATESGSQPSDIGSPNGRPRDVNPMVEQRTPTTYSRSTGSYGWNVSAAPVDPSSFDLLKQFTVEGVFSLENNEVKVLKLDGSRHKDFEGYLRLKFQNNRNITLPSKFDRVLKAIILKSPHQLDSYPGVTGSRISVVIGEETNAQMHVLGMNELGGSEYLHRYIAVFARKEDRYASLPATITTSETTKPVRLVVGEKFNLAGNSFEITRVEPFKRPTTSRRESLGRANYFSKIVIKSSNPTSTKSVAGRIIFNDYPPSYNYSFSVNETGDVVANKIDPNQPSSFRSNLPLPSDLYQIGGESSTSEIHFAAKVNPEYLKSALFTSTHSFKATLDNIPLFPGK